MLRKISFAGLVVCFFIVFCPPLASAGVEPSPFQPEINKLHSIELQGAAINKRLAKLDEFETLPEGTTNYMNAMAIQLNNLKIKLEEVLIVLPGISKDNPYEGQVEVVLALDSIRVDSKASFEIVESIVRKMGVEPVPWLPVFRNISIEIIERINIHISPVFDPIQLPQLPVLP